uniref:Uncharacterized protein n=1 Tax=Arundo donax TaxID=35708 RepID=A0A0A9BWH4_ARUDO
MILLQLWKTACVIIEWCLSTSTLVSGNFNCAK